MNDVFAFEWTSCIFESAFGIVSLHTTKRGAFKAMVAEANKRWQEDRNSQLMYGGGSRPRHSPLSHEAWRVIRIEVSNA